MIRGFALCAIYIWAILLSNYTHNLLHHFSDNSHKHETNCIIHSVVETPSDIHASKSHNPAISEDECLLQSSINHLLSQPNLKQKALSIEKCIFLTVDNIFLEEKTISLATSFTTHLTRGPPAIS